MAKYEITLKNSFGDPNEIVVNTAQGFDRALTLALGSHYDDENEICEIIIKRIEG